MTDESDEIDFGGESVNGPTSNEHTAPDFKYWARLQYWTAQESADLLLNIDPKKRNSHPLVNCWDEDEAQILDYFRTPEALLELLKRAVKVGQLNAEIRPMELLEWAKGNNICYPNEMEDALSSEGCVIKNWKDLYCNLKTYADGIEAELASKKK